MAKLGNDNDGTASGLKAVEMTLVPTFSTIQSNQLGSPKIIPALAVPGEHDDRNSHLGLHDAIAYRS